MDKLTIEQIKTYLIDCIGYAEQDLAIYDRGELINSVVDERECINYNK